MEKRNSKFKKIFGHFVNIVFILSIILLLFAGYSAYKFKNNPENAYLAGYKPIYVLTGSMEPTIKEHSVIIVKQTSYNDVNVGDIIMFEKDDKMITHRIIEKTDEGIRTKGDNNNIEDAFILNEKNIKAKVISIWNWTATFVNEIKTPFGIFKWFIMPILFILFLFCGLKLFKILNKEKNDKLNDSENKTD